MNATILSILIFIIALFLGIYFGKIFFSVNSKSEKASLEEKINGLLQLRNAKTSEPKKRRLPFNYRKRRLILKIFGNAIRSKRTK